MASPSPFIVDHPSPPMSMKKASSPQSPTSIEAFPDFQTTSASTFKPGQSLHRQTQSHSRLEPSVSNLQSQLPTRPFRSPSQRLPPTALLSANRTDPQHDIGSPAIDHNGDEQPHQRLPRAMPAPSLSGPSIRPTSSIAPGHLRNSTATIGRVQQNADELKSESLWADMQRTLADVELSAMSSSHLFNTPHSQALEKLRETQLALAQAWARSEHDENAGQESEEEVLVSDAEGGMHAGPMALRPGATDAKGAKGKDNKESHQQHNRHRSNSSNLGRDLEEETERDIRLARRRREANDHYFSQVNRGVLDVVARLDEVAAAMRTVEKESRAVWTEMGASGSTTGSDSELDNYSDVEEKPSPTVAKRSTRAPTTSTGTGATTESGTELSDTPVTPKKGWSFGKKESPKESKKSPKVKGR